MNRISPFKKDCELVEPVETRGPAGKARPKFAGCPIRKTSSGRHSDGHKDKIGSDPLAPPATSQLIYLQEKIQPGDQTPLPDLASAYHRAVMILLRRHDLFQYSALVSNIGHGLWRDAEAWLPTHAEAPDFQESFERVGPGSDESS